MREISQYQNNAGNFWNNDENIKWFIEKPSSQCLVDFLKDNTGKNKTALDLGCGAGRNTEVLFNFDYDTYACDLHQNMVAATKERLLKAGINQGVINNQVNLGDMLNLEFPNSFFDVVVCNGVFHNAYNLDELNQAISEVSRVLKNNGQLYFNLFSSECVDSFQLVGDSVYSTKEDLIMTLVSSQEFKKMCHNHNLEPVIDIVEYRRGVATGTRAVMRGVMIKK
jgi:ubiquinone/menaquinone biosynthesis C-methylase UbiE